MEKNTEIRGVKIDKEVLLIINKAAEKAGSFRKLAVIQSWLGHTSQEVTRIYARIEDMRAKKAALAKFPTL